MDSKENKAMNENINLIEILKDAPKGTKLWSSMLGDCYFEEYQERESTYPIRVRFTNHHKETDYRSLSAHGKEVEVASAECVIFPSKENRDWSTFKVPKKHKEFEPFQRVLVREWYDCKSVWTISLYSHYDDALDRHCLLGSEHVEDDRIIPYEGNENKIGKTVE